MTVFDITVHVSGQLAGYGDFCVRFGIIPREYGAGIRQHEFHGSRAASRRVRHQTCVIIRFRVRILIEAESALYSDRGTHIGFGVVVDVEQLGIGHRGAIQMLFGILGARWENYDITRKLVNEYWVRPDAGDIPKEAKIVENGCYW